MSLGALALFYVAAGANHFIAPEVYAPMMPPYLPWHAALIFISGVAEVGLGVAVLVPATRRLAAWGIVALLLAVFPANLHIAIHDVPLFGNEEGYGAANWIRVVLQLPLIGWALWHTRPEAAPPDAPPDAPTGDPEAT